MCSEHDQAGRDGVEVTEVTSNSDGLCACHREPWRSRWRPGGNVADDVSPHRRCFFLKRNEKGS